MKKFKEFIDSMFRKMGYVPAQQYIAPFVVGKFDIIKIQSSDIISPQDMANRTVGFILDNLKRQLHHELESRIIRDAIIGQHGEQRVTLTIYVCTNNRV